MVTQSRKIRLTEDDRAILRSWQYSDSMPSAYAVRARVILSIDEGQSISSTARSLGLSRPAVYKWLNRYASGEPEWYKDISRRPYRMPFMLSEADEAAIVFQASTLVSLSRKASARCIQSELLKQKARVPSKSTIQHVINQARTRGLLQQSTNQLPLDAKSRQSLLAFARGPTTPSCLGRRAKMVLLSAEGMPHSHIARQLSSSLPIVETWLRRFERDGVEGLYSRKTAKLRKDQDKSVQSEVFALLHSPPIEHGVNRTSWTIADLKMCLSNSGLVISEAVIRRIIKSGGYRWRKARKVLTSPDPDYRRKLNEVKRVLSQLGNKERFFFIDEFGPCAIRKRGGKKLVAPGEEYSIPQFQRSRGRLIITAALEMSANQVTHLYSQRKDSFEIIRLIDVLVQEYSDNETLYLSWDAASWHDSKVLRQYIDEHNHQVELLQEGTKLVVVPLPKSAQFLNVIESIFSGLARAVIHNSNYNSQEAAKQAIDRYFQERNVHYQLHPQRAGKKMWRQELVAVDFNEGQNCKDPRW